MKSHSDSKLFCVLDKVQYSPRILASDMGSLSKRKRPDRRQSDNVIQQFYKMPPKKRYSFTESDHRYNGSAHFQLDDRDQNGQNGLDPLPQRDEDEDALPPLLPMIGGTTLSALSSAESVNIPPKWSKSESVQISRKKGLNKKHRELMATSFSSSTESMRIGLKMKMRRKQAKRPLFPSAIQTAQSQRAPMTADRDAMSSMTRDAPFDGNHRKIPTPFPGPLTMGNLQKHQNTMSLAGLRVNSSKTDDSEMEMDDVMARGITPSPSPSRSPSDYDDDGIGSNPPVHSRNETYDVFLSGLGAEIKRQQQRESKLNVSEHAPNLSPNLNLNPNPRGTRTRTRATTRCHDADSQSVGGHPEDHGFTLRINSVDVDRIEDLKGHSLRHRVQRSQSMPRSHSLSRNGVTAYHGQNGQNHRGPPSGYLHAFDLPATPPLSSCGGMMSDGSFSRSEQVEIDDIAVNEDTMRRNKLMSIHLMTNDGHQRPQTKEARSPQKEDIKSEAKQSVSGHPDPHHDEGDSGQRPDPSRPKVGDVFFTKMLRMTFILNLSLESWSREWFINGMARALRTQDIRFRVHKQRGIANEYSYVSLLCRCDQYDMKQLKNTFEFTFICGEMEECIAQSVGRPKLKLIIASCLSYKHYQCLYPKQFLRWITTSKPNAAAIRIKRDPIDIDDDDEHRHRGTNQQQPNGADAADHRMQYHFAGMDKMSIIEADYIQLPFGQQQLMQNRSGNDIESATMSMEKSNDGMLTPPNRTILHFMSMAL